MFDSAKLACMSSLVDIEEAVKSLPPRQLSEFREWFARFDAEIWDRQFEADANAGRLDALAEQAIDDHRKGRSEGFA
jgi:hypothetical protein